MKFSFSNVLKTVLFATLLAAIFSGIAEHYGNAVAAVTFVGANFAAAQIVGNLSFGQTFGIKKLVPMNGFNNVVKAQPANSVQDTGAEWTYNAMYITLTNAGAVIPLSSLATHVSEIRIEADGDVIRRVTPALLLDYLQEKNLTGGLTNGAGADVCSAIIPFADPSRRDVTGEELTSLGTVGVKQLNVIVVLLDPGTSPTYALTGAVDVTIDNPKALSGFERWTVDSFTTVNGFISIPTLDLSEDIFGLLLHASNITRVALKVGGYVKFDATKAAIESALRTNGQGTLTANYFPVVFDYDRQLWSRLNLVKRDPSNPKIVTARASSAALEITATGAATISALRRTYSV